MVAARLAKLPFGSNQHAQVRASGRVLFGAVTTFQLGLDCLADERRPFLLSDNSIDPLREAIDALPRPRRLGRRRRRPGVAVVTPVGPSSKEGELSFAVPR